MKAYCISGIGANEKVFHQLKLDFEYVPVKWMPTNVSETLQDYAHKLCDQVDTSEPFVLIGVSYGGMLATEMNKFIRPEKTILISSTATRKELPWTLKFLGNTKIIYLVPSTFFTVPPFIIFWFFGINTKEGKRMITEIIGGIDKKFTKLSVKKILEWKNMDIAPNTLRIHGDKDRLLPAPLNVEYIEVKNAGHFMIGNRVEEVSEILNREFKLI
ncbi:alpha/beta hydrolase [Reichenbachiella sp. MALMAid0571]|uniref:alpha/beta hydrolase n=1 Tax=Reichenbachiella sp. MALMAid0571 TaxID=3143939 RepID=UPI0032DEA4B1